MQPGDRVAILSENRPEWAIADYACLALGAADVAIYPNLPSDQVAYILRDCGAVAIFVSTAEQAAKIAPIRGECPALRKVISFSDASAGVDLTLAALETSGASMDSGDRRAAFRDRALAVKPDDLATLIYTSGTTGEPKGVMLTHDNIYSNVMANVKAIPFGGGDVCLSFLPLSHIFERNGGHYLAMATGTSIAYAESNDAVPANMLEVRPTLVFSAPRLYEKMYARVLEKRVIGRSGQEADLFLGARRCRSLGRRDTRRDHAGRPAGGAVSHRPETRLL